MASILCFGEALIDFHQDGQDAHGHARAYVPFAGGAPANVAVAVAKLGGAARFAGMLSTDPFGDFLLDSLARAGVDTRLVARTADANTALAFVSHDASGDRSFTFYRPPAADLLFRAEHFRDDSFDGLAVFHVCSNSMTEAAIAQATRDGMQRARAAGALVSFDVNLRPALWPRELDPRPALWEALALADLVKVSAEEMAFLAVEGEEAMLERLWQGPTRLLLVTDGPARMRWFSRDAEGELPAYAIDTVDTTAAGDAFVGGLLCRLAEWSIDAAGLDDLITQLPRLHAVLRYAAACGALTAARQGSFTALPSADDVLAFMETHA